MFNNQVVTRFECQRITKEEKKSLYQNVFLSIVC